MPNPDQSPAAVLRAARERPILFSAPMVRAILDGRKTQTRRVVKPLGVVEVDGGGTPFVGRWDESEGHGWRRDVRCPYGVPGDRLWVRETWGYRGAMFTVGRPTRTVYVEYQADGGRREIVRPTDDASGIPRQVCRCTKPPPHEDWEGPTPEHIDELERFWKSWRPSIHMPRWASRITLEVTGVRVERLHDISEASILAEGVTCDVAATATGVPWSSIPTLHDAWRELWTHINGAESWAANPWVFVIEFRRAAAESAAEKGGW